MRICNAVFAEITGRNFNRLLYNHTVVERMFREPTIILLKGRYIVFF